MQKLQTVNAETLLYEPLEKPSFVVDSLIPTGLSLFCGSQKSQYYNKAWYTKEVPMKKEIYNCCFAN